MNRYKFKKGWIVIVCASLWGVAELSAGTMTIAIKADREINFVTATLDREWFLFTDATITVEDAQKADTVSDQLILANGKILKGRKVKLSPKNDLNIESLIHTPRQDRRPALLVAPLYAKDDGWALVSAGGDYWYEIFCNGKSCISTLEYGSGCPVSCEDKMFVVPVKKGKNVFAFYIQSGSAGWSCAIKTQLPTRENLKRLSHFDMIARIFPSSKELLYSPWVTHVRVGKAYVHFVTDGNIASAVEYRKKGVSKWTRCYELQNGYCHNDTDCHAIELRGLESDTDYEYRIVMFDIVHSGPRPGTEIIAPGIWTFHSAPEESKPFTFYAMGDTHMPHFNRLRMLEQYEKTSSFLKGEFFIHLGDMFSAYDRFYDESLGGFTDHFVNGNETVPLCIVHGNHERVGPEGILWNRCFSSREGKSYDAFRYGNTFFLVLDYWGYNEKTPDYSVRGELAKDQIEWLRKVILTPECQTATFRIVLNHLPPYYPCEMEGKPVDALMQTLSGVKWHLFLAGHVHYYLRTIPQHGEYYISPMDNRKQINVDIPRDYPVLVLDGGETPEAVNITEVKVTKSEITIRSMKSDGVPFDHFIIDQNGNVKNLMEITKLHYHKMNT